ncbi:uncharacterized protein LOC124664612 [Lolium rigidum]|uniref:uncharacterized protein LOC124664612 n=1 Tax=Lolium rigidum TaxID=89674 RepID=UPI001F5CB61E|nr:uncharacterized protein LOC124664612 [Lolium rigidum]
MEFRFRAGDRGPSSSASGDSPPVPLSHPRDGYFGGQGLQGPPPPPPSTEWEAARREGIIQMEVRRRLIEEEVRREFEAKGDLAFARGGFLPDPFFPPAHLMPPPMQMAMHPPPHAPPPMPFEEFGAWHGFNQFGPRPQAGFGERRRLSPPRPKPKHKLQLLEIEPSGRSEVQRMKRKADTISGPTVPKKVQKLTKDWSCALCQVSATCEAGLNEHLEGKKHKAKFAQCGTSKVITDSKDNLRKITGNKSGIEPCDEPKKICILVDGELHEVVQKNNYLWCDRCKVRCDSNVTMAGHLRSKKHNKRNKVWSSIEVVRMDTKINEDLSSPCESKVNTNDSTETQALIKGNIDMAIQVEECGLVENPVEIEKESTSMASEVESTNMANRYVETPVESMMESTDMTNDARHLVPTEE